MPQAQTSVTQPVPFTRLQIGNLTVTILSDGHLDLPAAAFSDIPADLQIPSDPIHFGANVWHVSDGARQVMIDTGSGSLLAARFPDTGGLARQLKRHDIDPAKIDDVILTHMHPDHVGGLMSEGIRLFPVARIHVSAREWAYWTDPALPGKTAEDRRAGVEAVQEIAAQYGEQADLHEGPADLGDGMSLVPAPGHTPGHVAVRVQSGDDAVLILGDAILNADLQAPAPQVRYALDHDPAQAVLTRQRLLGDLAETQMLCAATHFPAPGLGHIQKDRTGFKFQPLHETP